jgi:hypothetical protein
MMDSGRLGKRPTILADTPEIKCDLPTRLGNLDEDAGHECRTWIPSSKEAHQCHYTAREDDAH